MTPTEQQEDQFRQTARAWLDDAVSSLPPRPDHDDLAARRAYDVGWQKREFEAGYAGLGVPEEYGGRPATPMERLIYLEERARAGAPPPGSALVALTHAMSTILSEGTENQKSTLVPAILRGEEIWCQGFSETEAGSDLAALNCKAVREGDDYVINGHKIWTTHAAISDRCELLVRTDPDARHGGITYLACPMDLQGITVRPIRTLAGEREFAQVFFEDVRCPVEHRVGEENDGWRVAMVTFSHERGGTFVFDLVTARLKLQNLIGIAKTADGGRAWRDAGTRREIGQLGAALDGMWALTKQSVRDEMAGRPPGAGVSAGKIFLTETLQQLGDFGMKLLGRSALSLEDVFFDGGADIIHDRLRDTAWTIAGGTSQVQRNIVAERVLGLPKEKSWKS
jgi:alkylation response protein AidB-like acyl-CoA dehydrogenase